jgi:hypothetical protein
MSLSVYQGTTNLITIKDSIRILPSYLSKLAKIGTSKERVSNSVLVT